MGDVGGVVEWRGGHGRGEGENMVTGWGLRADILWWMQGHAWDGRDGGVWGHNRWPGGLCGKRERAVGPWEITPAPILPCGQLNYIHKLNILKIY